MQVAKRRKLVPGDIVVCKGIRTEIKEITFQEFWEGEGFYTAFFDTTGIYRSWKQWYDGGYVENNKGEQIYVGKN